MLFSNISLSQQNSVAREWNNLILEAIRNDFARPTVHARNLFHHSLIAYDAWAAYDNSKKTYFLGDTLHGYVCSFSGVNYPVDIHSAREEAISYASYRFIQSRYQNTPDFSSTSILIQNLMNQLGYDPSNTSTDYVNGGPAELGNYLAEQIYLYGLTDGSNEQNDYANIFYDQLNPPIIMSQPGNPNIQDPNHWQPITLTQTIDQSGNPVLSTPENLSPEWGEVHPFSLDSSMYNEHVRDGDTYKVYFDTVYPAYLDLSDSSSWESFYKWNHTLVSVWQSHLDPTDGVMWDISPGSIGNNSWYPSDSSQYAAFYDLTNGGDPGTGYTINPVTGIPYSPQIVPRGDYTRVLAEFWADGLDSETPPGHWFEIYHYVSDQPGFERKWQGIGPLLDTLEFDVKAQLTLGGTMHDAAISAWSLKGYYDYIRPVSAIRYMADLGQSSDTTAISYHPNGIPLLPGFIEIVQVGDSLAGQWNENVGKIKLFTWKGHEYIIDPLTEMAGVDWILAEKWWPYQRPTFVTPPFAGFVSGHSTFSRAAANTMEFITGSPYFPGGLGEFQAIQNQYLHFEEGPSATITLQWASYKDAADQCSLSRLWGGIHPPIDDIPGRIIGEEIGSLAFIKADALFDIDNPALISASVSDSVLSIADIGSQFSMYFTFNVPMDSSLVPSLTLFGSLSSAVSINQFVWIDSFKLELNLNVLTSTMQLFVTNVEIGNLFSGTGSPLSNYNFLNYFIVDTKKPLVNSIVPSENLVSNSTVGSSFVIDVEFNEACITTTNPILVLTAPTLVNPTFTLNMTSSFWSNDSTFSASYDVMDFNEEIPSIDVEVTNVFDLAANEINVSQNIDVFDIDTKSPLITSISTTDSLITQSDLSSPVFMIDVTFQEAMNTSILPTLTFLDQGNLYTSISQTPVQTFWTDTNQLSVSFLVSSNTNDLIPIDLSLSNVTDSIGNALLDSLQMSFIWSDMKSPEVLSIVPNKSIISDSVLGSSLYFIDVEFNEPMDTSNKPLVMHFTGQSLTNSLQYNLPISDFVDSLNYRAYYQVLDENTEIEAVHLKIDFGKDASGNTQVVDSSLNFIAIDTKNPSVINLNANDYILDQIGQSFDVTAIFDEPMLNTDSPSIQFSPVASSYLDLVDSMWINSSTYLFNYQLVSSTSQTTQFGVNLNSAVDEAGNTLIELDIADYFQIDEALGVVQLLDKKLLLYPNILRSGERLNIDGDLDQTTFHLLNSIGQIVQELVFTKVNSKYVSDAISLPPGMYLLTNGQMNAKIIIQ